MANPEHLAILKQGVDGWNEWRKENPNLLPDLAVASLHGEDLASVDLSGANLNGAHLAEAHLIEGNLQGAHLDGAHLYWAVLEGAHLDGAHLNGAHLDQADLHQVNLNGASLHGASLRMASLDEAHLIRANLSRADLYGANLYGANLYGAILDRAILDRANFSNAQLERVNFMSARMWWTVLGAVDLSTARGLDQVLHRGPSIIGIDTLYLSKGEIPEIFLRGAGVPDEIIALQSTLRGNPIEFYSSFISYSSKDEAFAKRLYADLQNNGVRCWFAPEDLKIGDKFPQLIEESIRVHDKLLLVLSENSISSNWVEREVEAALEREDREKRIVLFPIRLDDAVMSSATAWHLNERIERNVLYSSRSG
jgi:uncharacterized protein YjbI with pentapeptide repeats